MPNFTVFRLVLLICGLVLAAIACIGHPPAGTWPVLAAGGLCVYGACHWRE